MDKVECPYCGEERDEPDEAYEEDEMYEVECESCDKVFHVSPYYIKGYHEYKVPCLNGEPHDWQPICGVPKEYFKDRRRCSHCGEERKVGEKG